MKFMRRFLLILAFTIFVNSSPAIEGLKLTVRCPDVVLSWPSAAGETYIVQWRETLSPEAPWVTLTNYLPAEWGTNITTFTHSNRVDCPLGQVFGMMNLSGEQSRVMSTISSLTLQERAALKQAREAARLAALLEKCALEGREPYEWELKNQPSLPPSPEEVRAKILAARESRLVGMTAQNGSAENIDVPPTPGNGPIPQGGDSVIEPDCGFYRVVREGIHLYGITNGMILSGVVNLPIEYSLSSTDQLTGFNLYADGNPLIGVDATDTNEVRTLRWDTRMMPNGTYGLSAEANFLTEESVTNQPVSVTVSNVISFPNYFTRMFGDWLWINARASVYPADYEIAMYAEETNYLGSFHGSTANGMISFIWDLTDGGSYTFTNDNFRAEFYLVGTGAAGTNGPLPGPVPVPPATNSFAKETRWPGLGKFVVAYSAADNDPGKTFKIKSMVIGGVIGAEYGGVVSTLAQAAGGYYQLSGGNVYGSAAFELADATSRTELLGYLGNLEYRNFYFFGHGNKRAIAGVNPPSLILDQDIVSTLKNFLTSAKPANYHPYRLVFIDGCDTGKGNFCEGFGIPAQTLTNQYFINAGVRSRAFLGFKGTVPFNQQQWAARSQQLSYFFLDWQRGLRLDDCISNVVNGTYQQTQTLPNNWIIYGAKDLRINTPDPYP